MSTEFEPIRGSARIELTDVMFYTLIIGLRRLGWSSLFVLTLLGFSLWQVSSEFGSDLRTMDATEKHEMTSMLWQSLVPVFEFMLPLLAFSLFVFAVLLPALALWRAGRDRRTLSWSIDETGIRSTDALGAETLLPWSNIRKLRPGRRLLWLKVKPRAWRYLVRRAFTPEDQARLTQLARRMVPS